MCRYSTLDILKIYVYHITHCWIYYLIHLSNKDGRATSLPPSCPFLHQLINLIWLLITFSWLNTARRDCSQPCCITHWTLSPHKVPAIKLRLNQKKLGKWERNMLCVPCLKRLQRCYVQKEKSRSPGEHLKKCSAAEVSVHDSTIRKKLG